MSNKKDDKIARCSFCGKKQTMETVFIYVMNVLQFVKI